MDNFMFRQMAKRPGEEEEDYEAILIDWQGVCFDLVRGSFVFNGILVIESYFYPLAAACTLIVEFNN